MSKTNPNRKSLNKMAYNEIAWLRKKGHSPTDEDIINFHHLGEMSQYGGISDPALLRFAAVRVGSNLFYPMTIGASIWYSEQALKWFEGDDEMALLCLLYALAHARTPEIFDALDGHWKCYRTVRKWSKRIDLTESEAYKAVERFLPQVFESDTDEQDAEPCDYSPALAILTRFHGKDRDHWLWNEPAEYCINLIQKTIDMESGDDKPDPNNPAIRGQAEMIILRGEIMERTDG